MTELSKNTQVPQCDKTAVMCSAFYTPKIEEFYVGFEYESFEIPISSSFAFENKSPEWVKRKVVDINNSEYKGRALYHVSINNRYEENVDWNKNIISHKLNPMSEKLKKILLSKSDFSIEQIDEMSDAEGWSWIYAQKKSNKREIKGPQICFTGLRNT